MMTAFKSNGMEKTNDINMPVESKYWNSENDLQDVLLIQVDIGIP